MINKQSLERLLPRVFHLFILLLLALGVILRIATWWAGRNLVMDEANVARNLYELDFQSLALPLKYGIYAPPVFLWIEKIVTILFGFSERACWLYPLVCGIAGLFVFYKIVRKLMPDIAGWLPVGLWSLGILYVSFSVTLKQYMPDAFIGLCLIWLALNTDVLSGKRIRFIAIWVVAGSVAIWSSMPSVFILAGIGAYWLYLGIPAKSRKALLPLVLIGVVWLTQFFIYYKFILQAQIESSYLQNYHREYFLIALPKSAADWEHNYIRLYELVGYMGGWIAVAMVLHAAMLIIGVIALARQSVSRCVLIVVPVACTLCAAALNQFSLIERVVMFMYPLMLLIVGYGYWTVWKVRFVPVKVIILLAGLIAVFGYARFPLYFGDENITFQLSEGLDYLQTQGAKSNQLFLPEENEPSYVYYTTVHPSHRKYGALANARILHWNDNYATITSGRKDTAWFLFTEAYDETRQHQRIAEIGQNMKLFARVNQHHVWVYGFQPK